MAKKLYVGGIAYETSENGLKDAFAQAGTVVSATIIMDRMTGRSKGFGFVEMSNDAEAQAAIDLIAPPWANCPALRHVWCHAPWSCEQPCLVVRAILKEQKP